MSNDFYNHGSFPTTGSAATSASMRAELDLIAAGFDKMPDLTGTQDRLIVVNSSSTGLTTTNLLSLTPAGFVGIGTFPNPPLTPLHVNGNGGELVRLSINVDATAQQEPAIGFASRVTDTNPAVKISALEYDLSDRRASLLFYTRELDTDSLPTERMRITHDGLVGIGTGTPSQELHLYKDSNSVTSVYVENPNAGSSAATNLVLAPETGTAVFIAGSSTYGGSAITGGALGAGLYTSSGLTNGLSVGASAGPLKFFSGSTSVERARIDSNGRVIVGATTAPPTVETISPLASLSSAAGATDAQDFGIYNYQNAGGTARVRVGSKIFFARSRSGTVGSLGGIVSSGDILGQMRFSGDDGAALITGAEITSEVDGTPGTNDMPGRLVFSTTADGASTPTERMRIDSAGDVGIGTTTPITKLEVSGNNNTTWSVTASITGATMDVTAVAAGTIAVGDLVFASGVSPYTRVTAFGTGSGGNGTYTVSVFQTVASTTLNGAPTYGNTIIRITDTDTGAAAGQPTGALQFFTSDGSTPTAGVGAYVASINESNTPDSALVFGTRDNAGGGVDANERMRIDSSGNVGINTTSPAVKINVVGGTTSGAVDDAALFSGGVAGVAGSGAAIYLSGANTVARGVAIAGINTNGAGNAHAMTFSTSASTAAPTERMRIGEDGRLQINGANGLTSALVSTAGNFPLAAGVTAYQFRADATFDAANTSAVGFGSTYDFPSSGTFTSSYQFFAANIPALTGTAAVTNNYGVYVAAQTVGTNIYGVSSNIDAATDRWNFYAGGTADNYFAGKVGIAQTTPQKELHITSGATTGAMLRFENTITGIASGNAYGTIEFFGNDNSPSANGVRAKIDGVASNTTGATQLRFYATPSASTTQTLGLTVTTSGITTTGITATGTITQNNVAMSTGSVTMSSADTQVDVDITANFPASVSYGQYMMVDTQGVYLPSGATYATSSRLFKSWAQNIAWNGTTYVIAGAVLKYAAYNQDATNFPAGAVNASKVLTVVSTTQVLLRFQNRTTPAAGSNTYFTYKLEVHTV